MGCFRSSGAIRRACTGLAVISLLGLTACDGAPSASASNDGKKTNASPTTSPTPDAPPLTLAVTAPVDKATKVVTATDVVINTTGSVENVTLTSSDGKPVAGALADDGKTWRPGVQLAYSATYKLSVKAKSGDEEKTVTSSFTTMSRPGRIAGADIYFGDGDTVGIGMPLVVEFSRDIPVAQRAAIERRLLVSSTPKVEGSWHWYSGGEVRYRPKAYWAVGTKIAFRAAVGGLPMGGGAYGKRDRVANLTVGSAVVTKVNNATKTASVYKDGVLIKTMPVSLGKRATPTSSGTHVVMDRQTEMIFDSSTFGRPVDGPGGYRKKVYWDVRYTWKGEFFHAAPWSVGDQGKRNVSNGCVNLSPANAKWFYELSKKGDVVEIVGTEAKVSPGNGWGDWNLAWPQYVAGSALR
jgi:lipoprotein-anchoring transpeptidase ErfK/SrfK